MIQISWQEMQSEDNPFKEKFGQAMKDGIFYLGIPEELKKNIPESVQYAEKLRKQTELKSYRTASNILGYKRREDAQIVSFTALEHQWDHIFPNAILEIANVTHAIAIDVIKKALRRLSISEEVWSVATGGLTDNDGLVYFSINHYKPNKKMIGLIPHKDMGWITVLFINKHGLEKRNDEGVWEDIPPKEGYFVVNFGQAFEILVNSVNKLKACIHRVRRVEEERISFAAFLHQAHGTDMHNIDNEGNLIRAGSFEDMVKICYSEFDELQMENPDNQTI
jgi:isopenicillin N synthase-like dioxygenase